MNYRTDSHSLITATSLIDEYYGTCSEKENFSLTVIELGMILKEAFPDAKRVQRHVNGVRMWHYTLAKIEQTDDLLLWENIPNFTSALGWHLSTRAPTFFEWTKCHSQYSCDNRRIVYEVVINRDRTFRVKVNGNEVSNETLGISDLGSSKKTTLYLFRVLNELSLCKGFPVSSKITRKDAKGNIIRTTEEWLNRVDDSLFLTVRSLACRILVQNGYKRSSNLLCDQCSQIKRNCSVTSDNFSSTADKKRETYMSGEELRDKLRKEQVRRRNAERRNKYLLEKIENEMKVFDSEDHQDILTMFQRVDGEELSEDMKVFWEAQQKALSQTNSKGNRWHPK